VKPTTIDQLASGISKARAEVVNNVLSILVAYLGYKIESRQYGRFQGWYSRNLDVCLYWNDVWANDISKISAIHVNPRDFDLSGEVVDNVILSNYFTYKYNTFDGVELESVQELEELLSTLKLIGAFD
jgi:hypothetical protein